VCVDGVSDTTLVKDVEGRGALIASGRAPFDVLFFEANDRRALSRLPVLRKRIAADGAIWVIRPKGTPLISEADVLSAGKAAGLVDVKVVRFSDAQTAHRLVIPVAQR
jgi:hypothetical protein